MQIEELSERVVELEYTLDKMKRDGQRDRTRMAFRRNASLILWASLTAVAFVLGCMIG